MNVKPSKNNMQYAASKIILSASKYNIPIYGTIGDFSVFNKNQQEYREMLYFSKDLGINGSYAMTIEQVEIINDTFRLSNNERQEYEEIIKLSQTSKNAIFMYKNVMYGPPMVRMIKNKLNNDIPPNKF